MSILTRVRQRLEAWLVGLLEPLIARHLREMGERMVQAFAASDAKRLHDRGVLEAEFASVRVVVVGLSRDVEALRDTLRQDRTAIQKAVDDVTGRAEAVEQRMTRFGLRLKRVLDGDPLAMTDGPPRVLTGERRQ